MNFQKAKQMISQTAIGRFCLNQWENHRIRRPKVSYAQVGEDLILDSFFEGKKRGFYIDVGAYHPIHLSNTHLFYKRGWNGIQVEPNYQKYFLFKKYRSDTTTLNVGVGSTEGIKKFYLFKEETLSTFSEETVAINVSLGHTIVGVKDVQILKLDTIFAKYTKGIEIDFMSVDTEGFDMEVLKTNDWDLYRPHFVVVETVKYGNSVFGQKLNDTYDPYMESIGYGKVADTYLNTIYGDKTYVESKK